MFSSATLLNLSSIDMEWTHRPKVKPFCKKLKSRVSETWLQEIVHLSVFLKQEFTDCTNNKCPTQY